MDSWGRLYLVKALRPEVPAQREDLHVQDDIQPRGCTCEDLNALESEAPRDPLITYSQSQRVSNAALANAALVF